MTPESILQGLNLQKQNCGTYASRAIENPKSASIVSYSPIDGKALASVCSTTKDDYEKVIKEAQETFLKWRKVPAPQRGQLVREIAEALRKKKKELGALITLEMGKILAEGEGEVQEAIDIADFAVGLSRQLYGNTMHSERPEHRMYEQWHPLGLVGVISAFNFPVAVWAWNAMLAVVCGDVVLWKPSEITPLSAIATHKICQQIAEQHGFPGLFCLLNGEGSEVGSWMAHDSRIPLISATGSCRMGRSVGEAVAKRLGRSILELGGNNAIIVLKDADLDLVVRSTLFGAVGTAGQRCTSTRRILIESPIEQEFTERLIATYQQVAIGNPMQKGTLMGPLVHEGAVHSYNEALELVKQQGGKILYGGEVLKDMPSPFYVKPTIVKAHIDMKIVREETFAPIVYILSSPDTNQLFAWNNQVPQGLSSSIFTRSLKQAEKFLSAEGSDCGIANVNIGTSGAEIGGAFGGEKDTGGGREAGSDSWKAYMRRQTNTINFGDKLPLAQGIDFG